MERLKIISLLFILMLMLAYTNEKYQPRSDLNGNKTYFSEDVGGYDEDSNKQFYPRVQKIIDVFNKRIGKVKQNVNPTRVRYLKVGLMVANSTEDELPLILTTLEMGFKEAITILNPINVNLSIDFTRLPKGEGPKLFVADKNILKKNISMIIAFKNDFMMSYLISQSGFSYRIPIISPYTPSMEFGKKENYNFLTRIGISYKTIADTIKAFLEKYLKIFNYQYLSVSIYMVCDKNEYFFQCKPVKEKLLENNISVTYDYLGDLNVPIKKFNRTRIVIISFQIWKVREIMLEAQTKGYLENKDYIFISLNTFENIEDLRKPWYNVSRSEEENYRAKEAFRSLFFLTTNEQSQEEFIKKSDEIREVTQNIYGKSFNETIKGTIVAHYDALKIYAEAIKKADDRGLNIFDGLVINDFLWNATHKGIYSDFKIDDRGDRLSDLAILDMDKDTGLYERVTYFKGETKEIENELRAIDWNTVDNKPPLAIPTCGYDRLGCYDNTNMKIGSIAGSIMLGLIIIAFIVIFFAFRRAKFSSELKAMAWQISYSEFSKIHTLDKFVPFELPAHKQSISFSSARTFSKPKKKTSQCDVDMPSYPGSGRISSGVTVSSSNPISSSQIPRSGNKTPGFSSAFRRMNSNNNYSNNPDSLPNPNWTNTANEQIDHFSNQTGEETDKEKGSESRIDSRRKFRPALSESLRRITPSLISNKLFSFYSVDNDPYTDKKSPSKNSFYEHGEDTFKDKPLASPSVGQFDYPPMSIERKLSFETEMLSTRIVEEEKSSNAVREERSPMLYDSHVIPEQSASVSYRTQKNKFRKTSTFMPAIFRSNHGSIINDVNSTEGKHLLTESTNSINSNASNSGTRRFADTAIYKGNEVALKRLSDKERFNINRELQVEVKKIKEMNCDHLCRFIGACLEPVFPAIVTEYCARGSLHDVLDNTSIKLDPMFKMSMMQDICRGMLYLQSFNMPHRNLTSRNCLVDSRFVVKISDFGLQTLMQKRLSLFMNDSDYYYEKALFRAPEILDAFGIKPYYETGNFASDVYSFAIICQQILYRKGPFYCDKREMLSKEDMIEMIIHDDLRPTMEINNEERNEEIVAMIKSAWSRSPEYRPTFLAIKQNLKKMNKAGDSGNLLDNILQRMEQHAGNLENQVQKRTQQYLEEKEKAERLLYAMLPESVASQLIANKPVTAESYDCVTIYFSDIVGFTSISAKSTPMEVIEMLNQLYTMLDNLSSKYDVYKVETIGDAYMVVSGLPQRNGDAHVEEICSMALDFLDNILIFRIPHMQDQHMKLRIGVHSGPVCAGVVGRKMPRYCLFGDTVNTTSRMESTGLPLKIHISEESVELLLSTNRYFITERGLVPMKGKGEKRTFFLHGQIHPNTNDISIIDSIPHDKPVLGNMERYLQRSNYIASSEAQKASLVDGEADDSSQLRCRLSTGDKP